MGAHQVEQQERCLAKEVRTAIEDNNLGDSHRVIIVYEYPDDERGAAYKPEFDPKPVGISIVDKLPDIYSVGRQRLNKLQLEAYIASLQSILATLS